VFYRVYYRLVHIKIPNDIEKIEIFMKMCRIVLRNCVAERVAARTGCAAGDLTAVDGYLLLINVQVRQVNTVTRYLTV
jgi:hypothetical protein